MSDGVGGFLGNLFDVDLAEIIKASKDIVDEVVTSDEEKQEIAIRQSQVDLEFEKLKINAQMKTKEMQLESRELALKTKEQEYKDRDSARQMYQKDSSLQKQFAIVFLVGFIACTIGIMGMVFFYATGRGNDIPAWAAGMLGTIFGAFSMKIGTINDFLFGGSQGERDQAETRIQGDIQRQLSQASSSVSHDPEYQRDQEANSGTGV